MWYVVCGMWYVVCDMKRHISALDSLSSETTPPLQFNNLIALDSNAIYRISTLPSVVYIYTHHLHINAYAVCVCVWYVCTLTVFVYP